MLKRIVARVRPSPAMIVALLGVALGLGSTGWAANGGAFILGVINSATQRTALVANFNGSALQVDNTSTGASATALTLVVSAGHPPMTTNSATKVTNLNADSVDGLSSTAFARSTSEHWHYIGDPGEPAFLHGWHNLDPATVHLDATYQHAAYRVDANGIVHVRGLISGGTTGASTPFFFLPPAYCPWFVQVFPVTSASAFGEVRVYPGGTVFAWTGSSVWISLSGVDFPPWTLDFTLTNHSAVALGPIKRAPGTSGRPFIAR